MATIDLLITNADIVTMDDMRTVHSPGYLAIKDELIHSVGNQTECPHETAGKVIDAGGKAILPGFVNTHTHVHDILMRGGLSDDRSLYDWLFNIIYPGLAAYGPEEIEVSGSLYCIEAIRSGITTFVDNHDYAYDRIDMSTDGLISVYDRFGLRAVFVRQFIDHMPSDMDEYIGAVFAKGPKERLPWDVLENTNQAIGSMEAAIKRHHGRANGRIQVWPSFTVVTMTTVEGLLRVKDLARKHGGRVTGHVSETKFDNRRAGVSSIEFLATIGFLDSNLTAVHCVQVDDNDIRILSRTDTRVSHNPMSNMFVGEGLAPIVDMQAAGIVTGIGTDNATANNTVNMFQVMRSTALVQKGKYENAVAISAEKVLEMATIEGAKAIGMDKEIGSLEAGKKADVIVIDLSAPNMIPRHRIPSVLVYQTLGTEVETVIVDGQVLMEDRILTMLEAGEEQAILATAQAASDGVVARAQIEKDRGWRSYRAV